MPESSGFSQLNPNLVYRSKLFSLPTAIYFACNMSYTIVNTWLLNRIDEPQAISLSSNPSYMSSELVILPNTLAFGLYQFSFSVEITLVSSGMVMQSNVVNTFVQIIQTGLAVFATSQNDVSSVLIGFSQSYVLNPVLYSFDFDNAVTMSSLTFRFYCSPVDISAPLVTQVLNSIDLLTYQNNPAELTVSWNKTCFNSACM